MSFYRRNSAKSKVLAARHVAANKGPKHHYPPGFIAATMVARRAAEQLNDPRVRSAPASSAAYALAAAGHGKTVRVGSAVRFEPSTDEGRRLVHRHVEVDAMGNDTGWDVYHVDTIPLVVENLRRRADQQEKFDGISAKNEYPDKWGTLTAVLARLNPAREVPLTVMDLRDIMVKKWGMGEVINGKLTFDDSVLADGNIKLYDGVTKNGKSESWYIYDLSWILAEFLYHFATEAKKAHAEGKHA